MIEIDLRSDIERRSRELKVEQADIPKVAKIAIQVCAKAAAAEVPEHMQRIFDRPTPWTLNSVRVKKWPSENDLTAVVGFKDVGYKGGPSGAEGSVASFYLQPLMDGGPRQAKRLELLLRQRGILGSNEFLVPSKYMKLDQYGNVSRGTIQKVLANLNATFDAYSRTPHSGARGGKKKANYFFTRGGIRGQKLTAIWQRFPGGHAIPAFVVVSSAPKYRKIFDLAVIVLPAVQKLFPEAFEAAHKAILLARGE